MLGYTNVYEFGGINTWSGDIVTEEIEEVSEDKLSEQEVLDGTGVYCKEVDNPDDEETHYIMSVEIESDATVRIEAEYCYKDKAAHRLDGGHITTLIECYDEQAIWDEENNTYTLQIQDKDEKCIITLLKNNTIEVEFNNNPYPGYNGIYTRKFN